MRQILIDNTMNTNTIDIAPTVAPVQMINLVFPGKTIVIERDIIANFETLRNAIYDEHSEEFSDETTIPIANINNVEYCKFLFEWVRRNSATPLTGEDNITYFSKYKPAELYDIMVICDFLGNTQLLETIACYGVVEQIKGMESSEVAEVFNVEDGADMSVDDKRKCQEALADLNIDWVEDYINVPGI